MSLTCLQVQTGDSKAVVGEGHGHQVNGVETLTDAFASVGIDDTVRFFQNGSYVSGKSQKLGAQPKGIASSGDITAIATLKSLIIMKNDAGESLARSGSSTIAMSSAKFGVLCIC